jgi:hypothetical protein
MVAVVDCIHQLRNFLPEEHCGSVLRIGVLHGRCLGTGSDGKKGKPCRVLWPRPSQEAVSREEHQP